MKLKHFLKSYKYSKISKMARFLILIILLSIINQIEGKSYIIRKTISFNNGITVKVQGKVNKFLLEAMQILLSNPY